MKFFVIFEIFIFTILFISRVNLNNFLPFFISYEKLAIGANRFNTDGLNSLKYKILEFQAKPLYTWMLVEITPEDVSIFMSCIYFC